MNGDVFFGPRLPGVFDFTLLFEQSILSLLPVALFVLLSPLRIAALLRRDVLVQSGPLLWSKLATVGLLFCLQIALVALWSLPSTPKTSTSIAEAALAAVEVLGIGALSYLEHTKSDKPSALLDAYLFFTIILDIALARTFWIRPGLHAIAGVFTVSLVARAALLALEEAPKRLIVGEKEVARETRAGVISRSVFWWLNALFLNGARHLLEVENLGNINHKMDSRKLMAQLEETWDKDPKTFSHCLMKATFWTFRWQFVAGMLPRLMYSGFTYAQPFLINAVVNFVGDPGVENPGKVASGLIGATLLVYVGIAVTKAWYKHMTYQMLTMFRGGLASMVFKKTLKLDASLVKDSAPVTLMSTDIDGIVNAGVNIHDIWASYLELPVGIYLLYRQVGLPSLFILIPTVLTTVMGGIVAPAMGPARIKWNQAIQVRIGTTSTFLSQIKGAKMMGLTEYAHVLLRQLRIKELKLSVKFRWLMIQLNILATMSQQLTPVIVVLGAIFWTKAGSGLDVAAAFTALSVISIAETPLIMLLASMIQILGATGCFTRLQTFLLLEERKDWRSGAAASPKSSQASLLQSHSAKLEGDILPSSAKDIKLTTIPRGADLDRSIDTSGPIISIEDATFRVGDDIEVLRDINLTIHPGTLSMVVGRVGCGKSSFLRSLMGEVTLAKGRLTVNARGIAYCDQTPWLQNITIRDNIVGESPWDEEWLTTVIRACALDEDITMFPLADLTIVGSGGVALSGGQRQRVALARAAYSRKKLVVLDDVLSGLDNTTAQAVFQRLLGSDGLFRQGNTTVILATNHVDYLQAADCITMLEAGSIIHNQVAYDSLEPSVWGVLKDVSGKKRDVSDASSSDDEPKPEPAPKVTPELQSAMQTAPNMSRQTGDIDCYKIYLRSLGWNFFFILIVATAIQVGLGKMPQVWLKIWTQHGTGPHQLGYMGGYIAFALSAAIIQSLVMAWFILIGIPKSANYLHEMLLTSVMRAPLHFFTSTDSGITLNRFSQDMTLIDQQLPIAFLLTIMLGFQVLAETGLIASGASYVGIIIPFCIIALWFIQKYYLRTSRQMRFLDLEMKTPLYTQFTETLAGLGTIRAFGWSDSFLQENHLRLDTSQKPFYMLFCIQRWLEVVLDLFVSGMALVLVAVAVNTGSTQGGIGLSMVNLINFTGTLTLTINQWTQLETSLGAIARLKWFDETTPNESKEQEKETPPVDWPAKGLIELDNVTASYSDESDPVLQNISLRILPGQKVGICGRSGSGKSSLILTLLRLLELRSGSMRIDGVDLSTTPRQQIRSRLVALPQDPLKLSGTVRHNLDPLGKIQADELLTDVLRKTAIWPTVEGRGGLDAEMDELGFSVGQQQLFCFARALLSRSRVVLLDEATSSVDRKTDEEIRRVIDHQMDGRTVVEVAHRLSAIKDFDLVVVMAEGRVQEIGNPSELLQQTDSAFKSLWDSQGL